MAVSRSTPKSEASREKILDAGLEAMSRAGLSGVTLGPLAVDVGMSKSGMFAHFGSKDEVQIAILNRTSVAGSEVVVLPSLKAQPGRPRLEALVRNWFGWTVRAGLSGGCPVAAAMFELDDLEGPVRDHVLEMEKQWRKLLKSSVQEAVDLGHFREVLDVEQFVWETCAIYLGHHVSLRFIRDRKANSRAHAAFERLVQAASRVG